MIKFIKKEIDTDNFFWYNSPQFKGAYYGKERFFINVKIYDIRRI